MKVRMLTSIGGVKLSLSRGDEYPGFSDREAIRMIDHSYAVAVDPAEEAEVRERLAAEDAIAAEEQAGHEAAADVDTAPADAPVADEPGAPADAPAPQAEPAAEVVEPVEAEAEKPAPKKTAKKG